MTIKTSPEQKKTQTNILLLSGLYEAAKVVLFVSLIFSALREGWGLAELRGRAKLFPQDRKEKLKLGQVSLWYKYDGLVK